MATNRFLERIKENESRELPFKEKGANIANITNNAGRVAAEPRTALQAGRYTQRPYRIMARQFQAIEGLLRRYNAARPEQPPMRIDEIGRIMHELLIEQEDQIAALDRLRFKASYPKAKRGGRGV